MKTFPAAASAVLFLALATAGSSTIGSRDRLYRFNYESVLGTSLELKIVAASEARAEQAQAAALSEIDREAKILSGYDPASEFSRWMQTRNQPVRVAPELREVLGLFDQWRDRTGGALDASAETVTRVWKNAAAEQRMPTAGELAAAVATVKQQHWSLDAAAGTATHLSGAPLVLNSFAKSYIVDQAADAALASPDVHGVVVNIGGDLVVRGTLNEPVDIADPASDAENATPIESLMVHDRAVATSGNYRRGVEIGGRHYSHIVDPRTGQPADSIVSATVVAPSPADAGALATAFSVMQPSESARLAARLPGVEFLLVKNDGQRVASPGWKALRVPAAPLMAAASAGSGWDSSMQLTVSLELASKGRRPYLAAWIEDADKFPVRTMALWFEKPRWLPELKAWYKDDRVRSMAEGSDITRSVSSATRPAGKYTLQWDGKDNAGKLVKPGRYTVLIEAAREHGSYQLIRQEIDFSGVPKEVQLPAGAEIGPVSLDYHKVSR